VSFRTQLVLAAAYLLTAVVLALEIPLAINVDRRSASELQAAAVGRAAILAAQVADPVAAGSRGRVNQLVRAATRRKDERIVAVNRRGRVVADSAGRATVGAAWATAARPELRTALLQGRIDVRHRRSDTLGEDLLLVTVPIVDQERVAGAVRASLPTSAERDAVRASWLRLAVIGVAVVLAGTALAWILATPLSRAVARLGASADRIGRGELETPPEVSGPRELAALSRSFARMVEALRSSLEAQRDFLGSASHQLRTPLTALRLRLEAIQDEGGPAAEQAAKADAEVDRLQLLVGDMLDLARASSPDLRADPVDLGTAVQAASERWRAAADERGQRVVVRTNGHVRAWSSERDIADILDNLVENAIKYAGDGAEIVLEARPSDGRAGLSVADNGPGIPAAEEARVFERFYRGSTGRKSAPGTGLGLAIAAELARRWGGEIRLETRDGTHIEAVFPRPPTDP
jgi:signal transduction histidine kinase